MNALVMAHPFLAIVSAILLFVLQSCALNAPEQASARQGIEVAKPQSASSVLAIGWFESRYGAERVVVIAKEGSSIVVPYVGRKGDALAMRTYLDSAAAAGLGVALQIPGDFVRAGDMESIRSWLVEFRDHPAARLWYLFDEPEIHGVSPEKLTLAARLIRAEGKGLPIAVTFYRPQDASRRYTGSYDFLWLNYYPVFRGSPEFLGISVGGFAARVEAGRKAAKDSGASFGMILQAFGPTDEGENQFDRRLPSAAELSYMVWTSLSANPSHLLFWARYRSSETWIKSTFLPTMDPVFHIVTGGLEPMDHRGFSIRDSKAKLFPFRTSQGEFLAIINGSRPSKKTALTLPGNTEAEPVLIPASAEVSRQASGSLLLSLPSFAVIVLRLHR